MKRIKSQTRKHREVYFNGDFIPEIEARISIFDCALMYGDMVFEMTRSFNGKPYRLRDHLERLYGSLKYAEIDCGLTKSASERNRTSNALPPMMSPTARLTAPMRTAAIAVTSSGRELAIAVKVVPNRVWETPVTLTMAMELSPIA